MIDVYCHTSPSGKQYIGIASYGWRVRWSQHVYVAGKGGQSMISAAIRKYGRYAFEHEVLEQCETWTEACAAEIRWIESRGTRIVGYNILAGGDGGPRSPAMIAFLAERALYQTVPKRGVMGILAGLANEKTTCPS